jgi:hypothetical protein
MDRAEIPLLSVLSLIGSPASPRYWSRSNYLTLRIMGYFSSHVNMEGMGKRYRL